MSSTVLTKHKIGMSYADVLRKHDFIGRMVLQHPMLMNASFMGKCIFTHYCLISRHMHASDTRDQS